MSPIALPARTLGCTFDSRSTRARTYSIGIEPQYRRYTGSKCRTRAEVANGVVVGAVFDGTTGPISIVGVVDDEALATTTDEGDAFGAATFNGVSAYGSSGWAKLEGLTDGTNDTSGALTYGSIGCIAPDGCMNALNDSSSGCGEELAARGFTGGLAEGEVGELRGAAGAAGCFTSFGATTRRPAA